MQHLLILPFAGGTRVSFKELVTALEPTFTVHFLPFAMEALDYQALDQNQIVKELDQVLEEGEHWTILGHSMGGIMAMYYLGQGKHVHKIDHLFLSSSPHPEKFSALEEMVTFADDQALSEYLLKLGGISAEIMATEIFTDYMLPRIKKDFQIIRSVLSETIEIDQLRMTNATILCGTDEMTAEIYQPWQTTPLPLITLEGDHFAIFNQTEQVTELIKNKGAVQ